MKAILIKESLFKPKSQDQILSEIGNLIKKELGRNIENGSISGMRSVFTDTADLFVSQIIRQQVSEKLNVPVIEFKGYYTTSWGRAGQYLGPKVARTAIGIIDFDEQYKVIIAFNSQLTSVIGHLITNTCLYNSPAIYDVYYATYKETPQTSNIDNLVKHIKKLVKNYNESIS